MLIRDQKRSLRRAAFTLMEILIVVAIIVMLAGVGGYYAVQQFQEAKVSEAKIGAKKISQALETYKMQNGAYPNDITALMGKTDGGMGPYLTNSADVLDPWGKQYQYDPSGGRNTNEGGALIIIADVYTTTPDGRTVGNWSTNRK